MNIHRIIYALTLAASIIFYILYPPWISIYLLVLLLLIIPFDLIISLPGLLTKGMLFIAPEVLHKGSDAVLTLITTHKKSYPIRCIIAKLYVSGDGFSAARRFRCPADKDGKREVIIDTSHSGVTVFKLKRCWAVSILGLFSLPINLDIHKAVLVLPPPIKPANTKTLQRGIILYPKPGGGYSEEHDMRKYRYGDPVRSIHWKISAKFDSPIIRQPLAAPPHSRLVHVMKWDGELQRDLILGRLLWVSDYMLSRQMPFFVKYCDKAAYEVNSETDLTDYLRSALCQETEETEKSARAQTRFTWVFRIDA